VRHVIEQILPPEVVAVEAFEDPPDAKLFPGEERAITAAVERRRREFATGRVCAHLALEKLGRSPAAIGSGPRGEPRWPSGIVGSITHTDGYRACALASSSTIVALGIDAEPHGPLSERFRRAVARPEELPMILALAGDAPEVHWDRLLFCAKEAVYKAWSPLTGSWLGFKDAVVSIDPDAGTFTARVLIPAPGTERQTPTAFTGRWRVQGNLALTAVAVKPDG
jgi:4'-phosphopantetheinyl transferase EntD